MSATGSFVQSCLGKLAARVGLRSVVFEVTQRCNQDCVFCYNVWKRDGYPRAECDTSQALRILDRTITTYRPAVITFSGGEPLMRPDICELVQHATRRGAICNLITNGTLLTDKLAVDLLEAGVRNFEFTLLSAEREVHNGMVRRDSFDTLIEAIASVSAARGTVTTTFVATKRNIHTWPDTLELNAALGVSAILFNRFNIGGAGVEGASDLTLSAIELRNALAAADEGAGRYGISISCGTPVPPCVVDRTQYKRVHFTDCAVGTRRAYPTVDPAGNVRPCNHSPTILGNILTTGLPAILRSDGASEYAAGHPKACRDCASVKTCRGGCRAAAEVCGDPGGLDPFVDLCLNGKAAEPCGTCM